MILHHLRVHFQIIIHRFLARMAYRFDFMMSIIAAIVFQITLPAFVGVAYYAGASFGGWTFSQMMILLGALAIIRGFAFMSFMGILWNTIRVVKNGTLELFLIRPLSTIWLLAMYAFDEEDIGQVVGGVGILISGLLLEPVAGSWLLFVLLCIVGILFYFALALFCCALTIYFINTYRLWEFLFMLSLLGGYPKSIYSKKLGLIFSLILPVLITAYYPASALLGLPLEGVLLASFSSVFFVLLGFASVHAALKYYTGAGG